MANRIDHLLSFANETAAFNVLKNLGFAKLDKLDNIVWDRSRVDPGVKLITADAVVDTSVFPTVIITPEQTILGFHLSIALLEASDALEAIPPKALRVIENRGLATATSKFHEYAMPFKGLPEGVATDMPPGLINRAGGVIENLNFTISPRFAGSDYPVNI